MGFKNNLIKNVITPHTSQIFTNSMGKIYLYDKENNTASVLVSSSGSYTLLDDVPVQISGTGFISSNLKEGDNVYIQYNNGSVFQPKIVGIADEDYANNTKLKTKHKRKGSMLVEDYILEELDTSRVIPTNNKRFDKNSDQFKHMEFKDISCIDAINKKKEEIGYFQDEEVGLYHPILSSIVKLKNNGDIDIFTGTNIGIRINKDKKTIQTFGDSTSNSNNWTLISNNITVKSNSITIDSENINLNTKVLKINGEDASV